MFYTDMSCNGLIGHFLCCSEICLHRLPGLIEFKLNCIFDRCLRSIVFLSRLEVDSGQCEEKGLRELLSR